MYIVPAKEAIAHAKCCKMTAQEFGACYESHLAEQKDKTEQKMRQFFSPEKLYYLTFEAKRFRKRFSKFIRNFSKVSLDEKLSICQIIADAYCDFSGIPCHEVKFVWENKHDGYYSGVIALNMRSPRFLLNPYRMIEVLMHETRHAEQHVLEKRLDAGQINSNSPDYGPAIVFKYNADHYITPEESAVDYPTQPLETDAQAAGHAAKMAVYNNFDKAELIRLADDVMKYSAKGTTGKAREDLLRTAKHLNEAMIALYGISASTNTLQP